MEQTKIPYYKPLPASAERGGGGWRRGLPRSQAQRSAAPSSATQEEMLRLGGQRPRPELSGTPKTGRGLGGALERFPLQRGAERPYLKQGREARTRASVHGAKSPPAVLSPGFQRRRDLASAAASPSGSRPPPPPPPELFTPSGPAHRRRRRCRLFSTLAP